MLLLSGIDSDNRLAKFINSDGIITSVVVLFSAPISVNICSRFGRGIDSKRNFFNCAEGRREYLTAPQLALRLVSSLRRSYFDGEPIFHRASLLAASHGEILSL